MTAARSSAIARNGSSHERARYAVHDELAAGGMATVHLGTYVVAGARRVVAAKRMHPHLAKDEDFAAMFREEARILARLRHPNIVSLVDVEENEDGILIVMEYVHGESLHRLLRSARASGAPVPPAIASAIMLDVLAGLHAAHEARSALGENLELVHRDVSPHNVMLGEDGIGRVVDFGIARAAGRATSTRDGDVKGKAAYMAPEQIRGGALDRRVDVYAAGVVFWELLTGDQLFAGDSTATTMHNVLERHAEPPSRRAPEAAPLDGVVQRAMRRRPEARFPTARAMAEAIEAQVRPATHRQVGTWVTGLAGETLRARAERIALIESETSPSAVTERSLRSWRVAWAMPLAAAVVIALAGGAVAMASRGHAEHPPASVAAPAGATMASLAPREPPSSVSSSTPPPVLDAPAATSAGAPRGAGSTAPARPAGPRPRASAPPNDGCDPPYTLDADGVRVPKRKCL